MLDALNSHGNFSPNMNDSGRCCPYLGVARFPTDLLLFVDVKCTLVVHDKIGGSISTSSWLFRRNEARCSKHTVHIRQNTWLENVLTGKLMICRVRLHGFRLNGRHPLRRRQG